jgi:hypothetical protein
MAQKVVIDAAEALKARDSLADQDRNRLRWWMQLIPDHEVRFAERLKRF